MNLETAIRKAFDDAYVKELLKKGYFLGSVFATTKNLDKEVSSWIFHFFNSKKKTIVDCFVNKEVAIGEETPAISELKELKIDKIAVTIEKALAIVKKKEKSKIANVLVTLHLKEKNLVWTINVITVGMIANTYDIDSKTGKILEEKSTSLMSTITGKK